MPVDIRIHIDLTERQKRIMRVAVVTGTIIGALGIGIALATPIDTAWIQSGSPVSASSLAGNLNELNRRTILTVDGGASYSVGATKYCGITASSFTGSGIGGYAAAKSDCEAVTGCSATAHMCTGEELARSVALGASIPVGSGGEWYSSGSYSPGGASFATDDCAGWLEGASGFWGACWVNNPSNHQNGPSACSCGSTSVPIICCD